MNQGPIWGQFMKKTEVKKSRATVPLIYPSHHTAHNCDDSSIMRLIISTNNWVLPYVTCIGQIPPLCDWYQHPTIIPPLCKLTLANEKQFLRHATDFSHARRILHFVTDVSHRKSFLHYVVDICHRYVIFFSLMWLISTTNKWLHKEPYIGRLQVMWLMSATRR